MSLDAGKLLRINLNTGKAKVEPIPEQVKRDFGNSLLTGGDHGQKVSQIQTL